MHKIDCPQFFLVDLKKHTGCIHSKCIVVLSKTKKMSWSAIFRNNRTEELTGTKKQDLKTKVSYFSNPICKIVNKFQPSMFDPL